LQSRGHNVLAVDLYNTRRNDYIRADVRNYRQLENVFENNNFDYVYHLAAEYGRWNGEDYYENLWQTNMIGTKNILRLQEKLDFRMIFYSSAEVYGDYNGKMSEDVMTNKRYLSDERLRHHQMGRRINVHELCQDVWYRNCACQTC